MNITYTKKGDFCYPDLVYSKNDYPPLGKYGMLRKTYLKENFKAQYSLTLMNDTLWQHLLQIDEQAHTMLETMVTQMAKTTYYIACLNSEKKKYGAVFSAAREAVLRNR